MALKSVKPIWLDCMGWAEQLTTLAKVVGKKVKEEEIFDEVVDTVVSRAPNFKNIQCDLAETRYEIGGGSEEERAKRIPFGDDLRGCKILLTTRSQNVCIRMSCQPQVLLKLNEDEGLALLKSMRKGHFEWKIVFEKLRKSRLVDIRNAIDVVDVYAILKYGMGLALFPFVTQLNKRGTTASNGYKLIASCLLIDAGKEGFVKMHDVFAMLPWE
ncbi:uncharacterized protein LOC116137222 [Pistacia vera]|uniref:uncharacterized protein LOC116137222 n=1 Tax=Pistacia vera TaxID=55513 RepID=UPI001263D383|nr:uncharacterized protein LOC116137222 [Pistacia vera]